MADAEVIARPPPDLDRPLGDLREALTEPFGAAGRRMAEQAAFLLDQAWVNGSAATAGPALERLRRLADGPEKACGEAYRELLAIFAALGDRHTDACLPEPMGNQVAFLPFLARAFWEGGDRGLVITGAAAEGLERGDLLVAWDGRPIAEVLELHAARQLAANAEARAAKAVQTLSFRPLAWLPPPDAEQVLLTLRRRNGRERTVCLAWRLASREALDERFGSWGEADGGLSARVVETAYGRFGVIRIARLHARPDVLLGEVIQALDGLPPDGVVIDLRGCEQGIVAAAEGLLQLFSPRTIQPQPFEFRITPFVRDLVRTARALAPWAPAVETAAARGEAYSRGLPLTSPEAANAIGRRYFGPLIVLVDALTYSSAEMFAAGVQDHGIGAVVGTAASTGGGGASPLTQDLLHRLSGRAALEPGPQQPILRVAARRCRRVGRNRSRLLEGVGATPDQLHRPTLTDVLEGDRDLHRALASRLAQLRCD